jgi:hypothetical protein
MISAEWVQAIASVATLGAAAVALIIAAKAPRLAAQFAESYRRDSSIADEKQRMKMMVFTALVKGRRQLMHADTIAALNLLDIAFIDAPEIREAWRGFVDASERKPFEANLLVERYNTILASCSRHLGLYDRLTAEDLRLGYYPEGLGKMDQAAFTEAEDRLARAAAAKMVTNQP